MNPWLIVVLVALLLRLAVTLLADVLNLRRAHGGLPAALRASFDEATYSRSQAYLRANTRFGMVEDLALTGVLIAFILLGGFGAVDHWARSLGWPPLATGLAFTGALVLASRLLGLPFSIYDTFVVEQRFGFNRTTPRTFALDMAKGLLLLTLIGGPVYAAVIWLFDSAGPAAWLWVWATITTFQILLIFLAPYVIMPLFNTYTPLPEGDLRAAIEAYARAQRFTMQGIYTMDGSRRSSKTNAFFTGFGRSRRIVLFDTLIARHTVPELVAVLAHEMGHFKKRHILQAIARSIALTGCTLFLLSRCIGNAGLAAAFGVDTPSTYTSLVFFGFLYTPISMAVSLLEQAISRRHEYEADAYAAHTTGSAAPLVSALKTLSTDNLSNLTPHPFKVLVSYSHPPLLERIRALENRTGT
ncbi:MAG: M48 family metallopeptidase [Lentisphaerae bacterium]|nr:M48 family metallopeptidase [Lentisphaerota bacterium]